jgi:hypothetical protein
MIAMHIEFNRVGEDSDNLVEGEVGAVRVAKTRSGGNVVDTVSEHIYTCTDRRR